MCLLLTGAASAMRTVLLDTPRLLEDVYDSNSDGLGVMYATSRGLKVVKTLPESPAAARKFLSRLPADDRQVAVHWRMRTHGNIDLHNCHPYEIIPGEAALMHNGILHTGNKADPTKSDTWHFIEDYLKGHDHDVLHDPKFARLLADFIGDNRFAIMSGDGRLTVINEDQGVHASGVWFSNTYAWTPSMLIPGYRSRYTWTSGSYRGRDDDGRFSWAYNSLNAANDKDDDADEVPASVTLFDQVVTAVLDYDTRALSVLLEDTPAITLKVLLSAFDWRMYDRADPEDLTAFQRALMDAMLKRDHNELLDIVACHASGPDVLADLLLFWMVADLVDEDEDPVGDPASDQWQAFENALSEFDERSEAYAG